MALECMCGELGLKVLGAFKVLAFSLFQGFSFYAKVRLPEFMQ